MSRLARLSVNLSGNERFGAKIDFLRFLINTMGDDVDAGKLVRVARAFYSRFSRSAQQKEMRHLTRLIERVLANQKQDEKWRMIFRRQLNALIRREFIGKSDLAGARGLAARRFRLRSQNEEDGLILALLEAAGVATRQFVEIGCGRSGGNSAVLAREFGWNGLMIDSSRKAVEQLRMELKGNPSVAVIRAVMTPECVNDVLSDHGVTGEIDFLSIDIDSTDYWLLDAVTVCSPRVLVMEYNALFGPDRAVTVPLASIPKGAPKGYSGASLCALEKLARRKGYRLVVCEEAGVNAFFLRNDLAEDIPGLSPQQAYRPLIDKYDVFDSRPKKIDIYSLIENEKLELVEV